MQHPIHPASLLFLPRLLCHLDLTEGSVSGSWLLLKQPEVTVNRLMKGGGSSQSPLTTGSTADAFVVPTTERSNYLPNKSVEVR